MNKILKKLFKFLIFILLLIIVFIQGLIHFANKNDFSKQTQYVLVLGARANKGNLSKTLQERLKTATTYLKEHKNSKAILCGGTEKGDKFSQSYYMKEYLLKENIEKERLITEDKSKNTFENIKFALFKMDKKPTEVMIITSNYHIFRAKLILYRFGVLGYCVGAKVPKNIILKSYIRETLAVIKTYIFDRPTKEEIKKLYEK